MLKITHGKSLFFIKDAMMALSEDANPRRKLTVFSLIPILCHMEDTSTPQKTIAKATQVGFYWPTLLQDVRNFVLTCDQCQRIENI